MTKSSSDKKIAIIVLNYNNWLDTVKCLETIQQFEYPNYLTIVVDNGSHDDSIDKIKSWFNEESITNSTTVKIGSGRKPVFLVDYEKDIAEQGGIPSMETVLEEYSAESKVVLIRTKKNLGYSAGNNVGIKYAIKKNADAVLIINPDIRVQRRKALNSMVNTMFARDDIFVVGPNVIDSEGKRQSPLREPYFLEECINPFISAFLKRVGLKSKSRSYVEPIKSYYPYGVEKIGGSCLMIRTSFLEEIGLLDEGVFLYCEESILAAQVEKYKGKTFFMPKVVAYHLHDKPSKNMLSVFFNSRIYYLRKFKEYNRIQLITIMITQKIISGFFKVKARLI